MAAIAVHAALNTPGGDEKMAAEERRIKIDIRNQHPKSTSEIDIKGWLAAICDNRPQFPSVATLGDGW